MLLERAVRKEHADLSSKRDDVVLTLLEEEEDEEFVLLEKDLIVHAAAVEGVYVPLREGAELDWDVGPADEEDLQPVVEFDFDAFLNQPGSGGQAVGFDADLAVTGEEKGEAD